MHTIPYSSGKVRIPDSLIAGNEQSDNPVEFDIAPAWGPDLARLRSVIECAAVIEQNWAPEQQDVILKAFETSRGAFVNTVTAVRGLVVPAAMAKRAGFAVEPKSETYVVTTGAEFGRIAGDPNLLSIALFVAFEVMKLAQANAVDPRLFGLPSGSGGREIRGKRRTTARRAGKQRDAAGTVGKT